MTIRLYSSADDGAPTLTGTAGSLIGVLDACLVNGYGTRIPLGWTKAFSGVNLAAYQQGDGSLRYLRVDDTGTTSARIIGYDTMSDVNTGTLPFPTNAQVSGGGFFTKTNNFTVATPRNWYVVGDESYVYIHSQISLPTATANLTCAFFGDINDFGGVGNTMIVCDTALNLAGGSNLVVSVNVGSGSPTAVGHYMVYSYTGIGGSIGVAKHFTETLGSAGVSGGTSGFSGIPFPDHNTGKAMFSPFWVTQPGSPRMLRGEMPGMLASLSLAPFSNGYKFPADGDLFPNKYIYLRTNSATDQGFALQYEDDGTVAGIGNFFLFIPYV